MSEPQDFSNLPVEEKVSHSVWKVRLDGYTTLISQFENSRNDSDPCFDLFQSRPESLKSIVLDSNVVAQESAVLLLCKYLEYGCSAASGNRLKSSGIVLALCEKGLASSRAGTKAKSVDALLMLVEVSGSADWIVEQILPYLGNRLPKLVAGCVHALHQLVQNYGCAIVPPKLIIEPLAKLFAHADRNVRAETTKLTVELYIWLRDGLTSLLFSSLKPVQQRDLTAEFAKVEGSKPEQKRLTRSQKHELELREQAAAAAAASGSVDVVMEDASETESTPAFDPFDMLEPVEVLGQMPGDLYTRAASTKWKDRVEVLTEVQEVFAKAPKLANSDYTELVRLFAKCFKDANIQVVQLAANGVEALARGLKDGFARYRTLVLGPMVERSKEKKPAVADALASALDAIFASSALSDVLDEIMAGMKHKTPQVKISATHFLRRCLVTTAVAPTAAQIDQMMAVGVKLLADSQEPIRQAATEMIGTLMKITGERELKSLLEKVDDNRLAKVKAVYDTATVKASSSASKPANPVARRPDLSTAAKPSAPSPRLSQAPSLKKPAMTPQSIPSKRLASSPAKRADAATKAPLKSFTGRSLIQPTSNGPSIPAKPKAEPDLSPLLQEELRILKEENKRLREENAQGVTVQTTLMEDLRQLKNENFILAERLDSIQKQRTNDDLMMKQKDTQNMRLTNDLENAKLKIKSLEQSIEIINLRQPPVQTRAPQFSHPDTYASPSGSPSRTSSSKLTSSELSSRVNRLSIEGSTINSSSFESHPQEDSTVDQFGSDSRFARADPYEAGIPPTRPTITNADDGEENWRRATEVTAQLKARIEKMKQRNRLSKR